MTKQPSTKQSTEQKTEQNLVAKQPELLQSKHV
jgi:hypothetical protein